MRSVAIKRAYEPAVRSDGSRIRYKRVSESSGREVPNDRIVKGYELDKGTYVPVTEDELESAEPERTHTIDVEDCGSSTDPGSSNDQDGNDSRRTSQPGNSRAGQDNDPQSTNQRDAPRGELTNANRKLLKAGGPAGGSGKAHRGRWNG